MGSKGIILFMGSIDDLIAATGKHYHIMDRRVTVTRPTYERAQSAFLAELRAKHHAHGAVQYAAAFTEGGVRVKGYPIRLRE